MRLAAVIFLACSAKCYIVNTVHSSEGSPGGNVNTITHKAPP